MLKFNKIRPVLFFCSFIFQLLLYSQEKPNILFISIDDLNDYVSCMNGSINIPTPNIDRLAKQGTLFTNAHCQAPICGPSRASVMTGLYPSTTGNYLQLKDEHIKQANEASKKSIFMPDFFEKYGYKTMAVGKIYHQGDQANTFQEYGGHFIGHGLRPATRMNYDPGLLQNKKGRTMTDWGAFPDHDSIMGDFKIAEWAVNKLKQNHTKPFYLGVGFNKPHVPWHVPKKWFDLFPLENIKTPPYKENDFDDVPRMAQKVVEVPMMPTTEELKKWKQWKKVVQAYSACVAFTDAQVGKVLDALENSKYANNTIVVLWSDHGYHLGEKNRIAKQALWERDTRSILIIKDFNYKTSAECSAPVELIDIYPTLIDLCKLPKLEQLEGNSLKRLIKKPNKSWKSLALSFYGMGNISVRGTQFKLNQYEDGSLELYDMKNDPNEWYNLAYNAKFKKKIKRLQSHIPDNWADISEYSGYDINDYFKKKLKRKIIY